MSAEDVRWFLSTLAQCLAAIVGVGGMLVVFKLQRMHDTLENLLNQIRSYMELILGDKSEPYVISPEDWVKKWKKEDEATAKRKQGISESYLHVTNGTTLQIEQVLADRRALRRGFLQFATMYLVLIVLSLYALLHCTRIEFFKVGTSELEIFSAVVTVSLTTVMMLTLFLTIRYLKILLDLK